MDESLNAYLRDVERELARVEPLRRQRLIREVEAELLSELDTLSGDPEPIRALLARREDPRSLGQALAGMEAETLRLRLVIATGGALAMTFGAGIYFTFKDVIPWRVALIFGLTQGGAVGFILLSLRHLWMGRDQTVRRACGVVVGALGALPWSLLFGTRFHPEIVPYGAYLGWLSERYADGVGPWGWLVDNLAFTALIAAQDRFLHPGAFEGWQDVFGLVIFHACLQAGTALAMAWRRHLRGSWVLQEKVLEP